MGALTSVLLQILCISQFYARSTFENPSGYEQCVHCKNTSHNVLWKVFYLINYSHVSFFN